MIEGMAGASLNDEFFSQSRLTNYSAPRILPI